MSGVTSDSHNSLPTPHWWQRSVERDTTEIYCTDLEPQQFAALVHFALWKDVHPLPLIQQVQRALHALLVDAEASFDRKHAAKAKSKTAESWTSSDLPPVAKDPAVERISKTNFLGTHGPPHIVHVSHELGKFYC